MNDPPNTSMPAVARRPFLARVLAGVVGGLVGGVPIVSGLIAFFDPLGRRAKSGKQVRVTTLSAVPADGRPRMFSVVASRRDAWTQYPSQPIGAVYLSRTSEEEPPQAFSAVCPHLGCTVDFRPTSGNFVCPCHNSIFAVDGSRVDAATSPSPRDLDSLEVEIRNGQEVWVEYRRFVGGKREKIEE